MRLLAINRKQICTVNRNDDGQVCLPDLSLRLRQLAETLVSMAERTNSRCCQLGEMRAFGFCLHLRTKIVKECGLSTWQILRINLVKYLKQSELFCKYCSIFYHIKEFLRIFQHFQHFLAFFSIFQHFLAFLSVFQHFLAFFSIFQHFLAFFNFF